MSDKKKKKGSGDIDTFTGIETTGHDWDGLKELDIPAPRWWLIVWLVTIVFSIGYWVVYTNTSSCRWAYLPR